MLSRLSTFALSAAVAVTAPLTALAQQTPPAGPDWYGPGPWHMWGGYGFWWGPFFMMILVPFAVGLVIFLIVRPRRSTYAFGGPGPHSAQSALEILNERFAKGEIEQAEFEAKRRVILREE